MALAKSALAVLAERAPGVKTSPRPPLGVVGWEVKVGLILQLYAPRTLGKGT